METIKKHITYRIGDYVITDKANSRIWFAENGFYRNIFDGTIVAAVIVAEQSLSQRVKAVFVQLPDKTKMLIKEGNLQDYINRFIYESYKQEWLTQALTEIQDDLR